MIERSIIVTLMTKTLTSLTLSTPADAKLNHLLITDHDRITVEVHVIGQWDMRMG
jgi:hypothetical protein